MEQDPDHYAILGIRPSADQEVIAAAYRALAKKFHPDTGAPAGTASSERFRAVQQAYETLGEPEKRRHYDAQRYHDATAEVEAEAVSQRAVALGGRARGESGRLPGSGWHPSPEARRRAVLIAVALALAVLTGFGIFRVLAPPAPIPAPPPLAAPSGGGQTVTKQPKSDALPAAVPENPPVQSSAPPVRTPAARTPLYALVMYEKAAGTTTTLADGSLAFNSRKACEDFALTARQRRLDAATIATGAPPEIWFECREAASP